MENRSCHHLFVFVIAAISAGEGKCRHASGHAAVWCGLIVLWIFAHFSAGFRSGVGIMAATAALAASLGGLSPWMQVVLWGAATLTGRLCVCLWCRRYAVRARAATALVVGENTVLYHGRIYRAQPGCQATCPACGSLVRVLSHRDAPDGEPICTICVYGE